MKIKRSLALGLAGVMASVALAGCGAPANEDGKIRLQIGGWPPESETATVATYNGYKEALETLRPDVTVVPVTGNFSDEKNFAMKAAAKMLPTTYTTHFTEVQKTIRNGYAYDITDILKERGLLDALNPVLLETVKGSDGKVYAFPERTYVMGLSLNKKLFEQAGLVNEDGTVKAPDTYEQLAEYAKIIKDKTGKAGIAFCTANNCGGWHFMNIAWSYGVEFMKQREDGTWEATFNTPEAVAALQYIKDLKWKYDVLPSDTVIDQQTGFKLIAIDEAAMFISSPAQGIVSKFGMDPMNYAQAKVPAGPAGRFAQMGGGVYMFSNTATKEEVEAAFDWLKVMGLAEPNLDDAATAAKEATYKADLEEKGVVFPMAPIPVWSAPERVAKEEELNAKYCNVDKKNFASYMDMSDVTIKPEEPVACQQLYAVLDGCIQEVITNKDADCAALIAKACNDFQVNHLDKN
ncbi:MAG: extracellular solute-binding protein [Clostridia bacterium]|nr:extracellular solute-binding protein [Clostridia bacterium]